MSDPAKGTEKLVEAVLLTLARPFVDAAASTEAARGLIRSLGVPDFAVPIEVVEELGSACAGIRSFAEELSTDPLEEPETIEEVLALVARVRGLLQALEPVVGSVEKLRSLANVKLPEPLEVLRHLVDLILIRATAEVSAALPTLLGAIGVIDFETAVPAVTTPDGLSPFEMPIASLRLDRIPALIADPVRALSEVYFADRNLGDREGALFIADRLFPWLAAVASHLGAVTTYGSAALVAAADDADPNTHPSRGVLLLQGSTPEYVTWGMAVRLRSDAEGGAAFELLPWGELALDWKVADWKFETRFAAQPATLRVLLETDRLLPRGLEAPEGGSFEIACTLTPPATLRYRIGARDSAHVELAPPSVRIHMSASGTTFDAGFMLKFETLRAVLKFGEKDGFLAILASILPEEGIAVETSLGVGWSLGKGFQMECSGRSSGALRIEIPLSIDLFDVVSIRGLALGFGPRVDGSIPTVGISVATALGLRIGPVAASVDGLGIRFDLSFPGEGNGNLGPVNLGFGIAVPTGVGLSIEAGPVRGGGFLSIDPEAGRYIGIVELQLFNFGVTAIGVIDTKPPWGDGFAIFMLIGVRLPSIQLGWGFTLEAVGGLLGLHRSIDIRGLSGAVREGNLDHVLFPSNPAGDAKAIVQSIDAIFPLSQDTLVFAPIVEIGWGGGMVRAKIGIALSFGFGPQAEPGFRIVLLGKVDIYAPDPKAAIVELHLDIAGYIDTGRQELGIEARLHDSRIAIFDIAGGMAFRLRWGDDPYFALSLGGFHPAFRAPPDFPALERFSISYDLKFARVGFTAYLALTSNAFMFGAALEIYAEAGAFNIIGYAHLDAIFYFNPFRFQVSIEAGVALRFQKTVLIGIYVSIALSGPTPWIVEGEARITILFEIRIPFRLTWGDEERVLAEPVSATQLLLDQINSDASWRSLPPGSAIDRLSSSTRSLLEPFGQLQLRQLRVPLRQRIEKIGEAPLIEGPIAFAVGHVRVDGTDANVTLADTFDSFAPGQFVELDGAARISEPSFKTMVSGFTLACDVALMGPSLRALNNKLSVCIVRSNPALGGASGNVADGYCGLIASAGEGLASARYLQRSLRSRAWSPPATRVRLVADPAPPATPPPAALPAPPVGNEVQLTSWLRRGIGARAKLATTFSDLGTHVQVRVDVELSTAPPAGKTFSIEGPGEALLRPLDPAGVRCYPPSGGTLEPNFFPYVELDDADYPWRYSTVDTGSTAPDGRPHPWLMLVTLSEDGIQSEFRIEPPTPDRPYSLLKVHSSLLPPAEDAWLWGHVEVPADISAAASQGLIDEGLLATQRGRLRARLLSPRRLSPEKRHRCFLIPIHARAADPAATLGALAWTRESPQVVSVPVLFEFAFTARKAGDFQELAERLRLRTIDGLGRLRFDATDAFHRLGVPADLLSHVSDLTIESALRRLPVSPQTPARTWQVGTDPTPFESALREILDAPSRLVAGSSNEEQREDLVAAPPIYGRWPVGVAAIGEAVGTSLDWFRVLNLDPGIRVLAGLGAEIVRIQQEEFVAEAWRQVDGVVEAAQRARCLAASREVQTRVMRRYLAGSLALPIIASRLLAKLDNPAGGTLEEYVRSSSAPDGVLDPQWRRLTRPLGHLGKRVRRDDSIGKSGSEAPPFDPERELDWTAVTVRRRERRAFGTAAAIAEIDRATLGASERAALEQLDGLPSPAVTVRPTLDRRVLEDAIRAGLSPDRTHRIYLDAGSAPVTWRSEELLAYPEMPHALWLSLYQRFPEFLLAGLSRIPPDTILCLSTNPAFVEALLAGANHEMARELLWREYPTDQRGSYFRRFWRGAAADPQDILPIDQWTQALGTNDPSGREEGRVVILLRSELMERYPMMLLYAVPKGSMGDGTAVPAQVFRPVLELPLARDVRCWGFDIDASAARTVDYVLEEPPISGARFGLDEGAPDGTPKWSAIGAEAATGHIDLRVHRSSDSWWPGSDSSTAADVASLHQPRVRVVFEGFREE